MKRELLILCWSVFFLTACGQEAARDAYPAGNAVESEEAYAEPSQPDLAGKQLDRGPGNQAPADDPEPATKKVIRTADIRMEVKNYSVTRQAVGRLVSRFGAQISMEEEAKHSYRIENRLVIRLAPERLDSFILELEALALHVDHKSVQAQDVTRQYVDLETRLAAKRATVERYREILRTARNVQEVLAVEEKMRAVIEDIESTEQQLRYLGDQVQQSTVNLTLYEAFDQPEVRRRSFGQRLTHALADGWQFLLNILVGLAAVWPLVLIGTGLAWWLLRRRARRRK